MKKKIIAQPYKTKVLRKVIKVKDIWMFERNFTLKNKNWTLVETSTE